MMEFIINMIKDSKLLCYLQQSSGKPNLLRNGYANVVLDMVETQEIVYFTPVASLMLFLPNSLPNLSMSMLIEHQNINQMVSSQYFGFRIREYSSPRKSLNIFFYYQLCCKQILLFQGLTETRSITDVICAENCQ